MSQTLSKVALILFIYFLLNTFYSAIHTSPSEADSLYYHIPLAESFLAGDFWRAEYGTNLHMFFPASTESILAVFILFHIPLTLFNWFAILLLFISGYMLARVVQLSQSSAILFGVSICLLQTVTRWIFAQTVDIWLAIFYLHAIRLVIQPNISWKYLIQLGILLGLVVGSKYSGLGFFASFAIVFFTPLRKNLNLHQWIVLTIIVGVCGGFWYLRNFLVTGNPFYPLDSPFFRGVTSNNITEMLVWKTFLLYPKDMITAFFGEYAMWSLLILGFVFLLFYKKIRTSIGTTEKKLMFLSVLNGLVFLFLPSGDSYQLHVSQFRFSYVVIIPLMLCVFMLAKKWKKEDLLAIFTLSNLLTLSGLPYYPKLILIFIPITLSIFYPQEVQKLTKKYLFK